MAFFTGKGDDGTTKTLRNEPMSKGSLLAEALGTVDETNSFLGICKAKAASVDVRVREAGGVVQLHEIVHQVQKDLFIIQAELAGDSNKSINSQKVNHMEKIIESIEDELPKVKSFFVPGATELGAYFDATRTVARRAERRVIEAEVAADGDLVSDGTRSYVNRLSSLLYALARLSNHRLGGREEAPDYS